MSSVLAMSPRADGDHPEDITSPPAHGAPSARRDPGNYKTSSRTSLRRSSTRNPCEGKGRGLRKCPRAFAPPSWATHPGTALPTLPLPQQPQAAWLCWRGPQAARLSQEPTGGAEITGSRGREWERGGSRAEPPWSSAGAGAGPEITQGLTAPHDPHQQRSLRPPHVRHRGSLLTGTRLSHAPGLGPPDSALVAWSRIPVLSGVRCPKVCPLRQALVRPQVPAPYLAAGFVCLLFARIEFCFLKHFKGKATVNECAPQAAVSEQV